MTITNFLKDEYRLYATYDNYRSIASVVDGLKPSARKIVYAMQKLNVTTPVKVAQLQSKVAELTQYLHGEGSLGSIMVGLAQDFVGSNNLPLLKPEGSFGSRFNRASAATRYIFTCKNSLFDSIFRKEDLDILDKQYFEGEMIEPMFFIPVLPLLIVNGSEGIGNGFAQKILPRDVNDVIKYIASVLENKKTQTPMPAFKNFNGSVQQREAANAFETSGIFKRISPVEIEITEVPIGYDFVSYIKVLDDLCEKGTIRNYIDKSNTKTDSFHFVLKCDKPFVTLDDSTILEKLKLVKRVSENYTSLNAKNEIDQYQDIESILAEYIDVRKIYIQKRKEKQLAELLEKINTLKLKYEFITAVISDKIIINGRKKDEIIDSIAQLLPDASDKSDILLNLPIWSLTLEKKNEIRETMIGLVQERNDLGAMTIETIWLNELKDISAALKKFN